jgi:hypothetical protein
MRFADAGLVIGAGTVLVPANAPPRDIAVDVTDPRLLALLAAAHLRHTPASALTHIRRAADRWRAGDNALAAMHLALSRLDRLEHPVADAYRLFLADGLLEAGFDADTIVKAMDLDAPPGAQAFSKYSPDQPRVPAGSGRASGQWTDGASEPGSGAPGLGATVASEPLRRFIVELPRTFVVTPTPVASIGPFSDAVKRLADAVEIVDSVSKWRELGPKGEIAIAAAIRARGWQVLDEQVPIRTALGLRVADLMVHVPAGTAGNATAYDGFIEVKVNGGRYSALQQAKDALIGSVGGTLIRKAGPWKAGSLIKLETGLANVRITYEPK